MSVFFDTHAVLRCAVDVLFIFTFSMVHFSCACLYARYSVLRVAISRFESSGEGRQVGDVMSPWPVR